MGLPTFSVSWGTWHITPCIDKKVILNINYFGHLNSKVRKLLLLSTITLHITTRMSIRWGSQHLVSHEPPDKNTRVCLFSICSLLKFEEILKFYHPKIVFAIQINIQNILQYILYWKYDNYVDACVCSSFACLFPK